MSVRDIKRITEEQAHFYKPLISNNYSLEQLCDKATAFTLTPDPKDPRWDIVTYYEDSPFAQDGSLTPTEFVYVLVNGSCPGMVKIGMTIRDVDQRAKEISGATGVPTPWIPIYSFKCFNSYKLEQELHAHLDAVRVSDNREMFYMKTADAVRIVEQLGEKYTLPHLNS
jgi:hypothetical protein